MKKEPIFNGHTWIVVILAIVALTAIGLTELIIGLKLAEVEEDNITQAIEYVIFGTVPLQVIAGIIVIIKRVTWIPKGDQNYEKDK